MFEVDFIVNDSRRRAYYLAARLASAAANSRSLAIVAGAESLRFLFFCRRFVLVV